jgi:hypothetical protein
MHGLASDPIFEIHHQVLHPLVYPGHMIVSSVGINYKFSSSQQGFAGWQHQPVGTKRYHFIIPSDTTTIPLADILQLNSGPPEVTKDIYATSSVFESSGHLLHGLLHANGHGHLMRINGLEGGSAHLTGAFRKYGIAYRPTVDDTLHPRSKIRMLGCPGGGG